MSAKMGDKLRVRVFVHKMCGTRHLEGSLTHEYRHIIWSNLVHDCVHGVLSATLQEGDDAATAWLFRAGQPQWIVDSQSQIVNCGYAAVLCAALRIVNLRVLRLIPRARGHYSVST